MTDVLKNLIGSEETPKMSGSAGYHGGIVGEVPEVQLQKCSDFKVDLNSSLNSTNALDIASLIASACPFTPPPFTLTDKSNLSLVSVKLNG